MQPENWNRVVLEGRKPGQVIGVGCSDTEHLLVDVGKALFADLRRWLKCWIATTAARNINRFAINW